MDQESDSDEMTSAEGFPNHDNKLCPVCKADFEKLESIPSLCGICSKKVCDSCSSLVETTAKRQCHKCTQFISYISASTLRQLHEENLTNLELTEKLIAMQKEVQDGKYKLKEASEEAVKGEERILVIEALQGELAGNLKKLQELTMEFKNLSTERDELDVLLTEKEVKIERMSEELFRVKAEIFECKKNSNFIPPDCGELFLENQELKEKLKELEHEHYTYTHQMIEALELLKVQLYREQTENSGLKQIIDLSNEKELCEDLEQEKAKARELQEELKIAKRQIELMRGSRIEVAGFEPLGTEPVDEPATTPCKCVIY